MEAKRTFAAASRLAAPEDVETRRASATTLTFNNHQGMDELKQCKNEWMARLEDNDADFKDIFDAHDDLLTRFQLTTFMNSAMNVVKNDNYARELVAPSSTPPPRPFISTASGEIVVRRRPHTIPPMPTHRLKAISTALSPTSAALSTTTASLSGSGRINNSMMRYTSRVNKPPQQELMVVTGKVDYRKLKEEQKEVLAQTKAADLQYERMMDRFDQFNADVERRLSLMLLDSSSILPPLAEVQESKVLVTVPDMVYKKIESCPTEDVPADAL